jgi:hypothetical protein
VAASLCRRDQGLNAAKLACWLAFEPPFADEGPPARLNLRSRSGVDNVGVVGRDLLIQALGSMGEQVAVLVDGAALGRHIAPEPGPRLLQRGPAINNQERAINNQERAIRSFYASCAPSISRRPKPSIST